MTILEYVLFFEAEESAVVESQKLRVEQLKAAFEKSTVGTGCTSLDLDVALCGDPAKEQEYLNWIDLVRQRIQSFGEVIPAEYLDQFMPIPEYRGTSLSAEMFMTILEILAALIEGRDVPKSTWQVNE